ncbi:membrane-bound metal-dependent hydrolase [Halorhabdus utahensis DSM 12940]|uniref:Membrane-bound metal-dependent hydrolase n=1 Tax=Halorhabdus utahensis (strain DSM 12940 / JCM 11049 / AX-2) TaxID=519442 RepID=C7NP16_HALUD|nr:metal-dependent hydrolase [Halorhabdus utahensis]ACV10307.1 membrane-bound metal-dependent hydrolase [Halorhabdus utahensis DSM 12940]
MMLPTHALAGMALALPVAYVAPEFGGLALLAGLVGGMFPDFDMYVGHRKTLHYPVYYAALAAPFVAIALFLPSVPTVIAAVFLVGAALHSLTDVFGGGLELRPWEGNSERAVYDHYREQWIAPRQWIGYDGSPGDLALSYGLAAPLLIAIEGPFQWVVIAALAVASVYSAVRRCLPRIAVTALDVATPWLPEDVLSALPSRYRDGHPKSAGPSTSD